MKAIARSAMRENNLEPDFPAAAGDEVRALERQGVVQDARIRDLRNLLWCSIDNDDSRDLDQLTVAESLTAGTRVLVAVADVDAFVHRAGAIDAHAHHNTTSVYTAAQIFPMLPERLSTDLTSLNPDQERLAIVIDMHIGATGELISSDVYRARVHSKAKLAYNSVAAWLDGDAPIPERVRSVAGLDAQLRTQNAVAESMRSRRRANGALNFETAQSRPVFKDESLTDMRADEENTAKELIEDFMVAANGVIARFLADRNRPALRRVLRSPERWQRIVALAAEQGGQLPREPNAAALSEFLEARRQANPMHFADLSLAIIKLLGAGEYAVHLPNSPSTGHFGLAVNEYTHATAPNRRLPDLITQRLVKAAMIDAPAPYSVEELESLAAHCNEQQRNATKVERRVRKAATALLLASRIGQHFRAVVTGASAKGTWVRIERPLAEGKVIRGFEGLDVGDRISVELLAVDPERGFIDFAAARG
ncbi:MAG: RNB domain-containing ribonuclease [Steroidobacteraceae bacterium]